MKSDKLAKPLPGERFKGRGRIRKIQLVAPGFVTYITEGQQNAHSKRVTIIEWYEWCEKCSAVFLETATQQERA